MSFEKRVWVNGEIVDAANINSWEDGIDAALSNIEDHVENDDLHVTAEDKVRWNNKSDFSGLWQDLLDKPTEFNPAAHSHTADEIRGIIKTINGIKPDENGNIELEVSGGTGGAIIDDSMSSDNGLAGSRTWSIRKLVQELSGKTSQEDVRQIVQEEVSDIVDQVVQEKLENVDGTIAMGSSAPSNTGSFWLDTSQS